jgi:hypothetical protein
MMQPHEQRVVDEKKELDEKLYKLNQFIGGEIFLSLPYAERERLGRQSGVMRMYSEILQERITHFIGFEPKGGIVPTPGEHQ